MLEKVAKAIYFTGRGENGITPDHPAETARALAEKFWNSPNREQQEEKLLAFEQARAAIQAVKHALLHDDTIMSACKHPMSAAMTKARIEAVFKAIDGGM